MLIWKPWLDAMRFGFEVQSVIALRLLKIAAGGEGSGAESARMVTEKVKALAESQTAGAVACGFRGLRTGVPIDCGQ
jgi:hypothetical protein